MNQRILVALDTLVYNICDYMKNPTDINNTFVINNVLSSDTMWSESLNNTCIKDHMRITTDSSYSLDTYLLPLALSLQAHQNCIVHDFL